MSHVPQKVFIVPYRDRKPHKMVFIQVMSHILKNIDYKILFIHQTDSRLFNRGAMKNIGFLYVKKKWPNNWKNITLIFHDIDHIAFYKDQFSFDTVAKEVKHFLGYKHTLGGIFAIKAEDFYIAKGFPNIWTWGWEDNIFYSRIKRNNFKINYSEFLDAYTDVHKLICLWHGWDRNINTKNIVQIQKYNNNNISSIVDLQYNEENIEKNILMINVNKFNIKYSLYPNKTDVSSTNARIYNEKTKVILAKKKQQERNKFAHFKNLF